MSDETNTEKSTTAEDEASSVLDVVTDLVLGATIPTPIKRNAYKAFGQLCSAAIEIPVAYLEGVAAEKRAETEARIKIIGRSADQIAQQMKVDPEYARVAVKKFGQRVIREQVNLDMVSAIAAGELKETTNATDQRVGSGPEKTIDDDWLNNFEKEASQKSTQEMQFLFGRILAGEIKKPDSYSIKTVKILGELDSTVAKLFKKLCSVCVVLEIPDGSKVFDIRVPSLGGNAATNALNKYDLGFDQLNILHEYSLIIADYNSWFDYKSCVVKKNNQIDFPFLHQSRHWALLPSPDRVENHELKLSGVALSRAGRELLRVVDQDTMDEYTEALKEFFESRKLQMTEINIQNKT